MKWNFLLLLKLLNNFQLDKNCPYVIGVFS